MKALWLELKEKRTSYLFVAPFLAVFAVSCHFHSGGRGLTLPTST